MNMIAMRHRDAFSEISSPRTYLAQPPTHHLSRNESQPPNESKIEARKTDCESSCSHIVSKKKKIHHSSKNKRKKRVLFLASLLQTSKPHLLKSSLPLPTIIPPSTHLPPLPQPHTLPKRMRPHSPHKRPPAPLHHANLPLAHEPWRQQGPRATFDDRDVFCFAQEFEFGIAGLVLGDFVVGWW